MTSSLWSAGLVDLHPGRAYLPGQREVAGQVAVAGRRVDPEPHPDVVRARLARDRHRGARPAVIAERGASGELLRGERQVGAEVQARGGGVGPVRPELTHAHVGPSVAVDGQLGVPGLAAGRQREVHGVTRVERDVVQRGHLLPGSRGAGQLDRGRGRRAGGPAAATIASGAASRTAHAPPHRATRRGRRLLEAVRSGRRASRNGLAERQARRARAAARPVRDIGFLGCSMGFPFELAHLWT